MDSNIQNSVVAVYHHVEVLSAPHFTPGMLRSLGSGRYERAEIKTALATIKEGDRVLEMGAGAGIVGAVIAKKCKPAAILSIEANRQLIPHIRNLYTHNAVDDIISVRNCVVLSQDDAPERVGFRVRGNFLGSRLSTDEPEKGFLETIDVERYERLKSEFPHNAIVMDIEGAEMEFLRDANLAGVELIVFEVHRSVYGRKGMREIRQILSRKRFVMDQEISEAGVHVYRKLDRQNDEVGADGEVARDRE